MSTPVHFLPTVNDLWDINSTLSVGPNKTLAHSCLYTWVDWRVISRAMRVFSTFAGG